MSPYLLLFFFKFYFIYYYFYFFITAYHTNGLLSFFLSAYKFAVISSSFVPWHEHAWLLFACNKDETTVEVRHAVLTSLMVAFLIRDSGTILV